GERADAIDEKVAAYFRPFEFELATLAPDGSQVALARHGREGNIGILIVDVDGRSSRQHAIANGVEHALQQLLWLSPKLLAFTTRSRAVGVLDLAKGEIKPLLLSRDFDSYQPDPQLGARNRNVMQTPDMEAGPSPLPAGPLEQRREMSMQEALALAHVSGDLFGSESTRDGGRSLRPYLLGSKSGSTTTVLLEVRSDTELYRRGERRQITVPGNVYVFDRSSSIPASREELGSETALSAYASYDVDYLPPPLVVLELDTSKGRVKEILREDNWRRVWLDHKGEPRLALDQQGRRYRYLHRTTGSQKWVPLEALAKTATPLGFTAAAESLLAPRSVPLGFDANGSVLYIATNASSENFILRALDLTTGQLNAVEIGHPRYDLIEPTALTAGDVLRFDRHTGALAGVHFAAASRLTQWFDPRLAELQAVLQKKFAPARCEVREWNRERTRFLVELSGPDDAGRFVVADPAAGKLVNCGERASWLPAEQRNSTHEFDFVAENGRRLAGFITQPRQSRLNPAPLLIYFHDGPWFSDAPVFNRGAQALASLGFSVLQLNHRGSSGLGRTHLRAIDGGLDRAVLEDVQTFLHRIGHSTKSGPNSRLVAALGNGVGGYLAVRMAQLAPETFRCAVAINAPGDLDAWLSHPDETPTLLADLRRHFFGNDRAALRAASAIAAGAGTKVPVLVVHGTGNAYVPYSMGRELFQALKHSSDETAFLELRGAGHGGWSDTETARLFAELGRFFNATIYRYDVKIRTPQVVPERASGSE
ncbi:MAG: prolyl oligopeptidase family serine peptidase, partial [Verrucomicrobia bacterium]|nr:prolyl oligopeptidase family serine peptidase [Verrucomicrobiota bacterium]